MVETLVAVACVLVGLTVGYVLGSRSGGGASLAHANSQILSLEQRLAREATAAADAQAHLRSEHQRYVEQVRGDQDRLLAQFKALSADALAANQETFLRVAGERLARAQQSGQEDLARREEAVRLMVEPVAKALEQVQRQTSEADRLRAVGQAQMSEQVRQMVEASGRLDRKTTDFINTLRRSDVRGNWGEVQLRRVVELAGMVQHVDFEEQDSVTDSEGRNLRPDMTVRLAGGRTIVVDSKVALAALLEAFETEDEAVRAERLNAHARQVKKHVDDLAGKRYWEQFASAPEFVVMFVPSEAFYQSALEQDPALQEYAFAKRVVIATPTTLVAMLRTVAHAWKEDALAKNAHEVLTTGKELYDRLSTMGEHLAKVGKAIDNAGKAYNQTVASLESRVLVSARRFGAMQHIEREIDPSHQVETDVRRIAAPELEPAADASAFQDADASDN
ncbi:DNA recombination protein RmuC [Demequina sp.]|uniref:DNA recombination protein RmuC n=1 Tax=Demequina sp. TaxID=2050685 RepID=UPI003A866792